MDEKLLSELIAETADDLKQDADDLRCIDTARKTQATVAVETVADRLLELASAIRSCK